MNNLMLRETLEHVLFLIEINLKNIIVSIHLFVDADYLLENTKLWEKKFENQ